MNKYALESNDEVARLEDQSKQELYDYTKEFSGLLPLISGPFLDAGCGSGLVARYVAKQKPEINVTGCDFSLDRIVGAKKLGSEIENLRFIQGNLLKLPFGAAEFQSAACRFVLEYFSPKDQQKVVNEIFRCLKPGGYACLVDIDGMYHNLFPRPKSVDMLLFAVKKSHSIDLKVARRLPSFLRAAGFENVSWKVELMNFQGKNLEVEKHLMKDRFELARPYVTKLLGSEKKARNVERDFLLAMEQPDAVLYYNKLIAIGQKPTFKIVSK